MHTSFAHYKVGSVEISSPPPQRIEVTTPLNRPRSADSIFQTLTDDDDQSSRSSPTPTEIQTSHNRSSYTIKPDSMSKIHRFLHNYPPRSQNKVVRASRYLSVPASRCHHGYPYGLVSVSLATFSACLHHRRISSGYVAVGAKCG
jgi:hypothetical protein